MFSCAIIFALSCGALAQPLTAPVVDVSGSVPAPPVEDIDFAPFEGEDVGGGAAGPGLGLEGVCPDDGVVNPVDQPKPQYYINFGSFPGAPLPGWTALEEGGAQVPGVTFTGNLDTVRFPNNNVTAGSDSACVVPELYLTELTGRGAAGLTMAFQVVENVDYDVVMHFAENFILDGSLQRIFDVSVNGQPVVSQLNIAQEAGVLTGITKSTGSVRAQNGQILVSLMPTSEQPAINAIEVYPSAEFRSGVATPAVDRSVQLAAIFADFYSLLQSNELAEGVMGPGPV